MSVEGIDDNDFRVVRKTLNALSVLISILAFTKAEVSSLDLLGIDIELDGRKLYIALLIGYSYFIWRYFTKVPLLGGFWQAFLQFYLVSDSGIKKQHNYDRYKDDLLNGDPELRDKLGKRGGAQFLQMQAIRLAGRSIRNPRLSAAYHVATGDGGKNVTKDHDIRVSLWFVLRKLFVFCFRYDKFGDYIFPIFLVVLNVGFFLFASDWQCSIWNSSDQ